MLLCNDAFKQLYDIIKWYKLHVYILFFMENVIVNLHIFLGCGIRVFVNWKFNLRNFIKNIRRTYFINFCSNRITAKGIYIKPSL
jgi:hypothetical protein